MTPKERKEAEMRIKRYLRMEKITKVLHMHIEQSYEDFGKTTYIWNIKTNKGDWWIAEGMNVPMNLYSQGPIYLSADEAYSYHLGILQRMEEPNKENEILAEIPLDLEQVHEIRRKLNHAAQLVHIGMEPEEMQAIGLTCREALIALANELTKRNNQIVKDKQLKMSDFKGIANLFIDEYAPGVKNTTIRSHARKMVDISWSYASEIVHSSHKNFPDVKMCVILTATTVSIFENLFMKYLGFDIDPSCQNCGSKSIAVYQGDNKNEVIEHCTKCGEQKPVVLEGYSVTPKR